MCLNPIVRPNTNRTKSDRLIRYYNDKPVTVLAQSKLGNRVAANARAYGKDGDSAVIYVPCGHCCECVAAKQNALVQRVVAESSYNHLFFCTLTYDNKHLPVLEIEVPVCKDSESDCVPVDPGLFDVRSGSDSFTPDDAECWLEDPRNCPDITLRDTHLQDDKGHWIPNVPAGVESREEELEYETIRFPYADIHHVQLMMKNLRDNNPCDGRCIRYLAVSELGKANGRPHFHILFLVEKRDNDYGWYNGIYKVRPSVQYNLEKALWQAVFKYWSINVGTRKNPVYEKLFTYRKRFYGNRCYTNFDLHYVDPGKTVEGTGNVAFYVTKYIMKGSKQDSRRQQFLRLNLTESEYRSAWKTIKCRMLLSKGFGLDARFETTDVKIQYRNPNFNLADYANYLRLVVDDSDDLPPDVIDCPSPSHYRVEKRRLLIPNFDLCAKIRRELTQDVGLAPGPIFIDSTGHHRPLAHYYQTKAYIYTALDFLDIYFNYDDSHDRPHYMFTKEEKDELTRRHEKRLAAIDCNSSFDTSPALLFGGAESSESNRFVCYGN